jgi:hypothetical protein
MNWWNENVTPILSSPTAAGVFGSLLSLKWAPGANWIERVFSFLCGIACVLYLAPAIIGSMTIQSPWMPGLFNFLTGLLGMNLIAKAVDFVKNADWSTIWGAFLRGRP